MPTKPAIDAPETVEIHYCAGCGKLVMFDHVLPRTGWKHVVDMTPACQLLPVVVTYRRED